MTESREYLFLLDFFPLIEDIAEGNRVLGETLQRLALDGLLLETDLHTVRRIRILLELARDLGYVSAEVTAFLGRQLDLLVTT